MPPILTALLIALIGLGCVFSVGLGLPGTWMFLALAFGVELTDAWWAGPDAVTFGWPVLGVGLLLAVVAEVIEFFSGSWGSSAGGGSKRASTGAFIGGMVGGLLGTLVAPVLGTIVGALAGTFLGAFIGETTGESPRESKDAVKPAFTATLGRIVGLVAKLGIAMTVWLSVSVAALYYAWPA
jgi:uncharacterized protein YqgC (DUF456 family)